MKKEERPKPCEPNDAWGASYGSTTFLYWTIVCIVVFGTALITYLIASYQ